jgi:FtsH-binding integral membrane protein
MGLIRKVYGILTIQLGITALVTLVPFCFEGVRIAIVSSTEIAYGAAILAVIISLGLGYVKSLARKVPINYVLMFAFTACVAYIVAYICALVNDSFLVV